MPVHHHPNSNENVILITGKMYEILYEVVDGQLVETERHYLCPAEGKYGCQVPKGVWHTVEVLEPSVIYEGKDGKYGGRRIGSISDGSRLRVHG